MTATVAPSSTPAAAPGGGSWAPVEGRALAARLRGLGRPRPVVDPELAGGVRAWLEDEVTALIGTVPEPVGPLRLGKSMVNALLSCEAGAAARQGTPIVVTPAVARGSLVDALFRQWVTVGDIDDPLADGLAALLADGDRDGVVGYVAGLEAEDRRRLEAEVVAQAEDVMRRWPVPSPAWLARTQVRLAVPLVGGRLVVGGVVDLALGGPVGDVASVCLVEVKSGRRRVEHRADVHLYALLETLRSGAPPFQVATYYTATGELDAETVTEDTLVAAVRRLTAAVARLCRLAGGGEAERVPGPLCPWCPALDSCGPGRAAGLGRRLDEEEW